MRIVPVFIPHMGCMHECIFCNQRSITGARQPDFFEVEQIIKEGLAKSGPAQIAFYGGSFTAIPHNFFVGYLEVASSFIKTGEAVDIRISTRPDCIDDDILRTLRTYNVTTIELGVQSLSDNVLNIIKRGHTAADVYNAVSLIRQYDFQLILQMMVGLPGSDSEAELHTAIKIAELLPEGVRIYPVCVIKDTELYNLFACGEYTPPDIEQATQSCADILKIFQHGKINVIRIGLNPTEELSKGAIAAGAYHPAMGELVRSRVLRDEAEARLRGLCGEVTIYVKKGRTPLMRGQKNCNMKYFESNYPDIDIKILERQQESEVTVQ